MVTTTNKIDTKKIIRSLCDMTLLVIENHNRANKCIRQNDKKLAVTVLDNDKRIDNKFFFIQSEIEFAVTKALVTKNLRRVMAAIHIVAHIERIGDYAKKIAKFVIKNEEISPSSIRRITKVQNKFRKMIEQVPQMIENEDASLAKKIWNDDNEVDAIVEALRKEVVTSISNKSNELEVSERVFVLNIINALERAADHIVAICELIQYVETGQHLNHE